jgi:hypothetical protein
MSKVLAAAAAVAAVVIVALAGAATSAAFNRDLACSSARGKTVCTYDTAYRTTEQLRCADGIFSTRTGEHYSTVTWSIRGNFARKLNGIFPSGASAVPGVKILTTSSTDVQHWGDWQSLSAEASATTCAAGDFLIGDPD